MTSHSSGRQDRDTPADSPRDDSPLRVAIVGDLEPKPEPIFDNFERTVDIINRIDDDRRLDFVAGIGDIPHKGKTVQYEKATEHLKRLRSPFYPILGNEELEASTDRFFQYSEEWNDDPAAIPDLSYVKARKNVLFLFATATENGKDFSEEELDWIETQVTDHGDLPAILLIHAAPKNVYPEGRTMKSSNFDRILSLPNVTAVFSGHSHMSVDETTTYVQDQWDNHHIHVPGIERTKVGDEHVPRFRVVTVSPDGRAAVETYNVDEDRFEDRHEISFHIKTPVAGQEIE